jgi:hypothetical protein
MRHYSKKQELLDIITYLLLITLLACLAIGITDIIIQLMLRGTIRL